MVSFFHSFKYFLNSAQINPLIFFSYAHTETNHIEIVKKSSSPISRLQNRYISIDSAYRQPNVSKLIIGTQIRIKHGEFISRESIMRTRLTARLFWTDERLKWNPKEYNGTKTIRLNEYGLWSPSFIIAK